MKTLAKHLEENKKKPQSSFSLVFRYLNASLCQLCSDVIFWTGAFDWNLPFLPPTLKKFIYVRCSIWKKRCTSDCNHSLLREVFKFQTAKTQINSPFKAQSICASGPLQRTLVPWMNRLCLWNKCVSVQWRDCEKCFQSLNIVLSHRLKSCQYLQRSIDLLGAQSFTAYW